MGFFAEFSAWLDGLLALYIFNTTRLVASLLEPAIVTLGVLYVLVWGVLQALGKIEEPLIAGLQRIVVLAAILGIGLRLWLYEDVIVDTFYEAPAQFAAALVGADDSVETVDQIIVRGGDTANLLLAKGGVFEGWSFLLAGLVVYIVVGFTAVYAIFLLSLSRIALSVLLALGPFFIALMYFNVTRRFVEAWIAQLSNYAFVAILTVLVAALMLHVVSVATLQATAAGGEIQLAHAVRVCLAAGLTLLILRQVLPIAAGLASGVALSSFAAVSGAISGAGRRFSQFARGMTDQQTSRFDTPTRKAGFYTRAAVSALATAPFRVARHVRRNTLRT